MPTVFLSKTMVAYKIKKIKRDFFEKCKLIVNKKRWTPRESSAIIVIIEPMFPKKVEPMTEVKKNKNSSAKLRANNRYAAKNYDEIKFRVPKGEKDKLKQYAQEHDYSLNALIYDAVLRYRQILDESIRDQADREKSSDPSPSTDISFPSLSNPGGHKVVSLFSGMGSICLAFAQAGFDIIKAYEKDHAACDTFRSLFGSDRLIEGDLCHGDITGIPNADVLAVGFPDIVFDGNFDDISIFRHYHMILNRIFLVSEKVGPHVVYLEVDDANSVGDDEAYLSAEEKETRDIIESIKEELYHEIEYKFNSLGYNLWSTSLAANELSNLSQSGRKRYYIAMKNDSHVLPFIPPSLTVFKHKPAVELIRTAQKQDDFYYYRNSVSFERYVINSVKSRHILYLIHTSKVYDCLDSMCPGMNSTMINKRNTVVLMDDYGVRQLTPKEYLMFKGWPAEINFTRELSMEDRYRLAGSSATIDATNRFAEAIKYCLE